MDERTHSQTHLRTDGQPENMTPSAPVGGGSIKILQNSEAKASVPGTSNTLGE